LSSPPNRPSVPITSRRNKRNYPADASLRGPDPDPKQPVAATERGLLHPFLDYDAVPAYLNPRSDPMDGNGFLHLAARNAVGQQQPPEAER
jgi:hypothetical protein